MKKNLPVRLRRADESDIGFIFNSWLRSYRNSIFARNITNITFFSEHHKVIEKLVKHGQLVVACDNEDTTHLYGYICADYVDGIFCLHYMYVKHTYRNLGIGKTLLNAFEHDISHAAVYTHHTKMAERLAAKYNMVYHPYILINNYIDPSITSAPQDEEVVETYVDTRTVEAHTEDLDLTQETDIDLSSAKEAAEAYEAQEAEKDSIEEKEKAFEVEALKAAKAFQAKLKKKKESNNE